MEASIKTNEDILKLLPNRTIIRISCDKIIDNVNLIFKTATKNKLFAEGLLPTLAHALETWGVFTKKIKNDGAKFEDIWWKLSLWRDLAKNFF